MDVDLLLASLDAARWTLAGTEESGKRRLKAAVKVAQGVREQIAHIDGEHECACLMWHTIR